MNGLAVPIPTEMTPEQVRLFRKAMGVSQADLGTLLGSSTRAVEDWEAGRRRPPAMLSLAMAAIWENLPIDPSNLAARSSIRYMVDDTRTNLLNLAMLDPRPMNDDDRFEWAQKVQMAALSHSTAVATLSLTPGGVPWGPIADRLRMEAPTVTRLNAIEAALPTKF